MNSLPEEMQAPLAQFVRATELCYGDLCASIALYGSAVRGDFEVGQSDVNVLVLLRDAHRGALDDLREPLRTARHAIPLDPFVLTTDELSGAADVFPVLFADLAAHHEVLAGSPLLVPTPTEADLRLRIEQQARTKELELRHDFLRFVDDVERRADTLAELVSGLFILLEAIARLEDGDWPPSRDAGLARAAEIVGVETAAIDELRSWRSLHRDRSPPRVDSAYARALQTLRRVTRWADARDSPPAAG